MTTRTIGLLVTLALALVAVWIVATRASSSAPSTSTRQAEPAPEPAKPAIALSSKHSEPREAERPRPPVPRRDIVPRITPPGTPAPASALPAQESARRSISAEAAAAAADAHRLFREGDFASARVAADGVLTHARGDRAMVRVAAISACALGDPHGAAAYLQRADRKLRNTVELACADHGVRLPPPETPERTRDGGATRPAQPRTR